MVYNEERSKKNEPFAPYRKYGLWQACVLKNATADGELSPKLYCGFLMNFLPIVYSPAHSCQLNMSMNVYILQVNAYYTRYFRPTRNFLKIHWSINT